MEQLVARRAHNPKVTGSSPVPATNSGFLIFRKLLFYYVLMFTVYGLHSSKHKKIYIGRTSDLDSRMLSHNKLATKGWTRRYRPWKVVYTEQCEIKSQAIKREKQLKTAKGRAFIWKIIKDREES